MSDIEKFRRFPLRRIQPVLKRFFAVFHLNLDRLQQHRQNIEKFPSRSSDVNRERIYALQTVEQLVVTLKQIRQTRVQVEQDDLATFDLQLMEILNGAVLLSAQFLVLLCEGKHVDQTDESQWTVTGVSATLEDMTHCSICTDRFVDPRGLPCMHTFCLRCLQQYAKGKGPGWPSMCPICRRDFPIPAGGVDAIPRNFMMAQLVAMSHGDEKKATAEVGGGDDNDAKSEADEDENVKALETKLHEFNDLIQDLFSLIEGRDNGLQSASLSTDEHRTSGGLSKFKLLLLPVAGAVIGGALAGPVGLVVGLKAGKVAAIGGGLLGLTGGTILKRTKSVQSSSLDETSEDAVELNRIRSPSSPALSVDVPHRRSIGEADEK